MRTDSNDGEAEPNIDPTLDVDDNGDANDDDQGMS
jgi:hypothetical protein